VYTTHFDKQTPYVDRIPVGSSVVLDSGDLIDILPQHIYYLTAHTLRQAGANQRWTGETLLTSYSAFLNDVGLEIRQAGEGGWVVGTKEQLDNIRVLGLVFDWHSDPEQSGAQFDHELANSLFGYAARAFSKITEYGSSPTPITTALGVGFARLADDRGGVLLTACTRTGSEIRGGLIQRIRVDESNPHHPIVEWTFGDFGRHIPEFNFDLNGDGYQDLLFSSVRDNSYCFVLSGLDGSLIVQFDGNEVVLGEADDSPRVYLSAKYFPQDGFDEPVGLAVLAFEGSSIRVIPADAGKIQGRESASWSQVILGVLGELGVREEKISVIRLPGRNARAFPPRVNVIVPRDVIGWCLLTSDWNSERFLRIDSVFEGNVRRTIAYSPE
jgi:hypothetical protein